MSVRPHLTRVKCHSHSVNEESGKGASPWLSRLKCSQGQRSNMWLIILLTLGDSERSPVLQRELTD